MTTKTQIRSSKVYARLVNILAARLTKSGFEATMENGFLYAKRGGRRMSVEPTVRAIKGLVG